MQDNLIYQGHKNINQGLSIVIGKTFLRSNLQWYGTNGRG